MDKEEVNHPAHYNHGKIEAITVIRDWKLNFNLGNALKYICRANHKGTYLKDLKKILWYIQDEINFIDGVPFDPNACVRCKCTFVSSEALRDHICDPLYSKQPRPGGSAGGPAVFTTSKQVVDKEDTKEFKYGQLCPRVGCVLDVLHTGLCSHLRSE